MPDLRRLFLSFIVLSLCLFPEEYRAEVTANDAFMFALADDEQGNPQSALETSSGEEQAPPVSRSPEKLPATEKKPSAKASRMPAAPSQTRAPSAAPKQLPPASRGASATLAATDADQEVTRPPKPSSLIQMFEGREDELMVWVGIAITFFIIGWISGGNFYLRRDRKRSRKLRF